MIRAIQTSYAGYKFRSRLEARWAVFFDAAGIPFEYEPEGLILSDGSYYLPDFYLPDISVYLEVARKGLPREEMEEVQRKISDGMRCGNWAGLLALGDPMDDCLTVFIPLEVDDSGGGSYEAKVSLGLHPKTLRPCLLAYEDVREREFYTTFDCSQRISMNTACYGLYSRKSFINSKIRQARHLSRQARFEYGETPSIREEERL